MKSSWWKTLTAWFIGSGPSRPNRSPRNPYSARLAATGGTIPYTWSLTSGTLPSGLALSASTGAIAGTPTIAVSATPLTFGATDSSRPPQSRSVSLTLSIASATLAVTTTSLPIGKVGSPYIATLAATGINGWLLERSVRIEYQLGALNNIRVGPIPGVSYRFVANRTGTINQLRFYLIVNASKPGYNAGTGGTLSIQLETDDGIRSHYPSGVVLGSATIPQPSMTFPVVTLSPAPQVIEGNLYHVVFANIDPNPTAN
jgi:hypothetical protein